MGHFIVFNTMNSLGSIERKVGQLLHQCCRNQSNVTICKHGETLQHIGFPALPPQASHDISCVNVVEWLIFVEFQVLAKTSIPL